MTPARRRAILIVAGIAAFLGLYLGGIAAIVTADGACAELSLIAEGPTARFDNLEEDYELGLVGHCSLTLNDGQVVGHTEVRWYGLVNLIAWPVAAWFAVAGVFGLVSWRRALLVVAACAAGFVLGGVIYFGGVETFLDQVSQD